MSRLLRDARLGRALIFLIALCTAAIAAAQSIHVIGNTAGGSSSVDATSRSFKTSATARTSDATATADPDLAFSGVAAGTYVIEADLLLATAGAGSGFRAGLGGTATATSWAGDCVRWESAFSSSVQNRLSTFNTPLAEPTGTVTLRLSCTGVLVTSTSGTVAIIWGQNASSVDPTPRQAGSSFSITPVP